MELFEVFNGKYAYSSWYYTFKLLANLELSSNLYKLKQVEREETTYSKGPKSSRTKVFKNISRGSAKKGMKKNLPCVD